MKLNKMSAAIVDGVDMGTEFIALYRKLAALDPDGAREMFERVKARAESSEILRLVSRGSE